MDRLLRFFRMLSLSILMLLVLTCFYPIFAFNQPNDQIVITVNELICPEEYTVDLSQVQTVQFDYLLNSDSIQPKSVKWSFENANNLASINNNGLAVFNSTTVPGHPLALSVLVNNKLKETVNVSVIDSSITPQKLTDFTVKNDPLYIPNTQKNVDLLDNIIPIPSSTDFNLEDFRIFYKNTDFSIIDGIFYTNSVKKGESLIRFVLKSDPNVEVIYNLIVTDPQDLEEITTESEITLTTETQNKQLKVGFTPENSTESFYSNISFSSSDPRIVTIDSYGYLTAHQLGTVTIVVEVTKPDGTILTSETLVNVIEPVPLENISLNSDLIELTTLSNGKTQEQLEVSFEPKNTTETNLKYRSLAPSVVAVDEKGVLTALEEGKATITVTSETGQSIPVSVNVSNNKIVVDHLSVVALNPDEFTVIARNVHLNSALQLASTLSNTYIDKVNCFAFSSDNLDDLNAKIMQPEIGTNNWRITLPVNKNEINNYFKDASNINIHLYGISNNNDVNMIGVTNYNYVNFGTSKSNLTITPYVQDIGFITPSVGEYITAGTIGESKNLEGIRISSPISALGLEYKVYITGQGWSNWTTSGHYAGTMGLNKGIKGISIDLTGPMAQVYTVVYRAHIQNFGWTDWTINGNELGFPDSELNIEAIEVYLEKN